MNPPKLLVRATDKPVLKPGRRSLDKGKDTSVIGTDAVEVPNTLYYRKRIAHGELEEVKTP